MAGIDRLEILQAIERLLKADSTLYGENKLIDNISYKIREYNNTRVDVGKPYKMFLKLTQKTKLETRMNANTDYQYMVEYRIEGKSKDSEIAYEKVDDIDTQLDFIIYSQMHNGDKLASYISHAGSEVIDMEHENSNLDIIEEDESSSIKIESEGTIRIDINHITQ